MISFENFTVKDFCAQSFTFNYTDISYFDTSNILPNFDSKQMGRVFFQLKVMGHEKTNGEFAIAHYSEKVKEEKF